MYAHVQTEIAIYELEQSGTMYQARKSMKKRSSAHRQYVKSKTNTRQLSIHETRQQLRTPRATPSERHKAHERLHDHIGGRNQSNFTNSTR